MDEARKDYTPEEMEYAVFRVESVAEALSTDAGAVFDAFTVKSDLLDSYIIPCYDVLHTQGKSYIVADLLDRLREKGVAL